MSPLVQVPMKLMGIDLLSQPIQQDQVLIHLFYKVCGAVVTPCMLSTQFCQYGFESWGLHWIR